MRTWCALWLALAACTAPEIPEDRYTCVIDDDCPPRMICGSEERCVRGEDPKMDGGMDAGRLDATVTDAAPLDTPPTDTAPAPDGSP